MDVRTTSARGQATADSGVRRRWTVSSPAMVEIELPATELDELNTKMKIKSL
jgi:hypothetical protein